MNKTTIAFTRRLLMSLFLAMVLTSFSKYHDQVFCQGDTAGIGISDYEVQVNVELGQSKTFEIARVSNEGTLGLTFKATWISMDISSCALIGLLFYL